MIRTASTTPTTNGRRALATLGPIKLPPKFEVFARKIIDDAL